MKRKKQPAESPESAPFTEVAGAGDEITPEAFQEETDELLREKNARNSKSRPAKAPQRHRRSEKV